MQPMLFGEEERRRRSDEDGGIRTDQDTGGNRPGKIFHGRAAKEVQTNQYGERGKRGQQGTGAVSYTHLDVYKRQPPRALPTITFV